MVSATVDSIAPGLEVIDLIDYPAFSARPAGPPNPAAQMLLIERLSAALLKDPDSILQWLVNSALDICSADSAGISMEHSIDAESSLDSSFDPTSLGYQWIATAGQYGPLQHSVLPRRPSACDICLDRGRPQLYRVSERFLRSIGVDAASVTDGLMVPWEADGRRGTIWVLAHGRNEAFDPRHLETLELLARFAALCVNQDRRKKEKEREWALLAASAVIKVLAHRIQDPIHQIAHLTFLAQIGRWDGTAKSLADQLAEPLLTLTSIVEDSLGSDVRSRPN
jgi:hypothetical protein